MAWKKLELKLPDISTDTLEDVIKKIKEVLALIVDTLEVILLFLATVSDPLVAAIKAAIEILKKTVESFLEDLGGYVLYVPIRKRLMTNFLGLGDVTPSWADSLGIFGSDASQVKWNNPELGEFLVLANRYNGGNMGFFRTVVESLYDEGDRNRPQFFDDDDWVGGIVLVMGVDFDPLGFLDDIWKIFGMFDGPDTLPKVPRPKGLKGRTIASNVESGRFTALLSWDPLETPIFKLEDLGGIVLLPERYAIMRGRNTIGALSATSVIDLMGKRQLTKGDTFSNNQIEVIVEDNYDVSKVSYIDEDIPTGANDAFYYAVAWKLKAYGADEPIKEGSGTAIDYWYISNVVRLVPYPTLPASTPPDWYRTPSIASIFPQLAEVLRKIVAQIENLANRILGPIDMAKQYIEFLNSEVQRYEQLINDILDEIAKLIAKFELPTTGIYTRTFKGRGGNDFFITDLAKSFLPSEKNRPPFTRGDEYVTGTVIMTGGNLAAVDAFITGLSLIFGGGSEGSELDDSLSLLGEAVNEAENYYFGSDFAQGVAPAAVDANAMMTRLKKCSAFADGPVYTFNSKMEPTDASS